MHDTKAKTEYGKTSPWLAVGLVAHVDAGKTTLSEAMLYETGVLRKAGRVDHGTAFLDTAEIEKERGITVFAKEASFDLGDKRIRLVDTPGHADFSGETERALAVMDYAVLIISGAEGVQSHTLTLWQLLQAYEIPTFIFVNKMDRAEASHEEIMAEIRRSLGGNPPGDGLGGNPFGDGLGGRDPQGAGSGGKNHGRIFAEFSGGEAVDAEEAACAAEELMEEYLSGGVLSNEKLAAAVAESDLTPVCFGSALKLEGIDGFLRTLDALTRKKEYGADFGAVVYKIDRDKQGQRLTHMKITGGELTVRMPLPGLGPAEKSEKAEQIRLYAGKSFETVSAVGAGALCAVTGLSGTYAGQRLGAEAARKERPPHLEATQSYKVILPQGEEPAAALQKLRQLEEENPLLDISWNEAAKEISLCVMGRLELEILQRLIEERFGMRVDFGRGSVLYKETIRNAAIGVGHFEPLRHYAEVRLLLEPLPRGSGIVLESAVSEDKLALNWQRLILTHLAECRHPGVLTGAPLTDVKITVIGGRAHVKHTEGGDFRQAAYRAVRQGLMKAESLLLEPWCRFRAEVPAQSAGRLLADVQRLGGSCRISEGSLNAAPSGKAPSDMAVTQIEGRGPAAALNEYGGEVEQYTKGRGKFSCIADGYGECQNAAEVIEKLAYDPGGDLARPTGSVFCSGGSAVFVPWDEVDAAAHTESDYEIIDGRAVSKAELRKGSGSIDESLSRGAEERRAAGTRGGQADPKELEAIFTRTYGKSKRDEALRREQLSRRSRKGGEAATARPAAAGQTGTASGRTGGAAQRRETEEREHMVVDGYNVIFAWEELKELAAENLDSARETLLEVLENYCAYRKIEMTVVFDGYKVSGSPGSRVSYNGIEAVYTGEAKTADRFIEELIYERGKKTRFTVVTSDRPVQMAALGDGAGRMSAREFRQEVLNVSEEIRAKLSSQRRAKNTPFAGRLDTADKTGNDGK